MKYLGSKAHLFLDNCNASNIVASGNLEANTKYFVIEKGENSELPVESGMFFITNNPIQLVTGDKVFLIEEGRVCKTACSLEISQGSVDISTDCESGSIPDGKIDVSGSFGTLFDYDEQTGDFNNVTDIVLSKFVDMVIDDKTGAYNIIPKDDSEMFLLVLLNSGTPDVEIYLFCKIALTSLSFGLENNNPQSKSISWVKTDGRMHIYKRKK